MVSAGGTDATTAGGFFDLNATSVYRADVGEALGVDGPRRLVAFLERELIETRLDAARRPHGAAVSPAR